jgi:hypothetical protein
MFSLDYFKCTISTSKLGPNSKLHINFLCKLSYLKYKETLGKSYVVKGLNLEFFVFNQ